MKESIGQATSLMVVGTATCRIKCITPQPISVIPPEELKENEFSTLHQLEARQPKVVRLDTVDL